MCDEYRNLVLSVASIESCVVCGEYRILCCLWQVLNLVLSVMSIESCVVWRVLKSCVVCGEYRILCCLASIEILSVVSIEMLCCVW